MSADKRTVATDALETLGMIITENEKRDAIHLAVENCIAAHALPPGAHVGLLPDGRAGTVDNPVGIVDPFLTRAVMAGERFWLVVYPRQIKSLRHVWEHPAFPASGETEAPTQLNGSEMWIRNFAAMIGTTYDRLMDGAADYVADGDYMSMGDNEAYSDYYGEFKTFWKHYRALTGTGPGEDRDEDCFLSCAC